MSRRVSTEYPQKGRGELAVEQPEKKLTPEKDWKIVRQRPIIKKKIERIAKSIHKNQREGGTVSMETARELAEQAVRQSYYYDNFLPDRFKPKPGTKGGYFDRGIDGEIKDKDKIIKEIERGNIPQDGPSGKKIWLPPSAR